jgi:hypothetical protein
MVATFSTEMALDKIFENREKHACGAEARGRLGALIVRAEALTYQP